ncbi:MAG: single-stranded DNA-binding protein [Nocardiopsaceae bacterium]|nr:single-stranded DNA-binding protein [Nocardiopsaceae bacterium]
MNETLVTVVGSLTADPQVKFLEDGTMLCRFTVATTPRLFERTSGAWHDGNPVFLNCSVWRRYAENTAASLSKGTRVIVTGELRQRRYTDARGASRTVVDLRVHEVAPSLKWAVAEVDRWGADQGRDPRPAVPAPRAEDAQAPRHVPP